MLRYFLAALGSALIATAVVSGSFFALQHECSSDDPSIKFNNPTNPDRTNEDTKNRNPSKQGSDPQSNQSKNPAGAFELRVTKWNKVEGHYYSENSEREKGNWTHKFLCETKIGEFALSIFTFLLVLFTGGLWWSTHNLWRVTKIVADADRPHMIPSEFKISGLNGETGDDGNIRVEFEYRFVNYGRSPAFVKRYQIVQRIGDELPATPEYPNEYLESKYIIAVNGWWGSMNPAGILIPVAEIAAVMAGTTNFFIYGQVEYGDPAGQNHKMRFAYRFIFNDQGVSERWPTAGPQSYHEYT